MYFYFIFSLGTCMFSTSHIHMLITTRRQILRYVTVVSFYVLFKIFVKALHS